MSTALATIEPTRGAGTTLEIWREVADLAKSIANTDFVPKAMRNNPAAVTAAILTGTELGFSPMASLSAIFIVDGRPGLYAEGMRALVQSHGHEIWPDDDEYTSVKVTLWARRDGTDRTAKVTWTIDMADKAGLKSKQNWRGYPRQMLLARATGELCRLMFADVLRGVPYTVEELQDGFFDNAPTAEVEEAEKPKAITRKASQPTRKAAPKPTPQAAAEPPLPPLPGEEAEDAKTPTPPTSQPEASSPDTSDPDAVKRAQQIAMRCNDAGLDDDGRHGLISAVTSGQKTSGKELTGEEAAEVLSAAREIKEGRLTLVEDGGRWDLVPIEQAPAEVPDFDQFGDEAEWDSDTWRAYLASRDGVVKIAGLIKKAQELAADQGEEPPTNLSGLAGKASVCGLLRAWVEDLYEEQAAQ